MKTLRKQTFLAAAAAVSVLGLSPIALAAGSASLYLTPASATVVDGQNLTLTLYENSGSTTINSVQAYLNYPSASLTYKSATLGSSFNLVAQNSGGSGTVKLAASATTPVSGVQKYATIYFTAAKSSGTAAITFDNANSGVADATTHQGLSLTTTGGSYTLSAPASKSGGSGSTGGTTGHSGSTSSGDTSSGSSGGSASAASSSSSGAKTSSKPDTKAPVISDISVSNLSAQSATISWKTSEPATSEVDFGLGAKYTGSLTSATKTTYHSLSIDANYLVAGQVYHYRIKSADAAGNVGVSADKTFETPAVGAAKTSPSAKAKSTTYLVIALGVAGGLAVLAIGAAWYIRRLHASSAITNSHVFTGAGVSPPVQPPGNITVPGGAAPDPAKTPKK